MDCRDSEALLHPPFTAIKPFQASGGGCCVLARLGRAGSWPSAMSEALKSTQSKAARSKVEAVELVQSGAAAGQTLFGTRCQSYLVKADCSKLTAQSCLVKTACSKLTGQS